MEKKFLTLPYTQTKSQGNDHHALDTSLLTNEKEIFPKPSKSYSTMIQKSSNYVKNDNLSPSTCRPLPQRTVP
jgi:hypothetical protein